MGLVSGGDRSSRKEIDCHLDPRSSKGIDGAFVARKVGIELPAIHGAITFTSSAHLQIGPAIPASDSEFRNG